MKNKLEIFYIITIIIFCIISFIIFEGNIYSPYSDIGREVYLAEQVKNGTILYKDIFNVYSPLGYWLNGLILKIFGTKLIIFESIGLIISILTIIPLFLISKAYTNKHLAFFITLFLISSCTFYPSISNWITPYSYSIIYALCTTIWAFWFLYKFLNNKNPQYLYISSFFTGLSICFKYEFIGLFILILAISIYKKEYLKPLLFFIVSPLICFTTLLIQGCNFIDIKNAFIYIIEVSRNEATQYFYHYAGISPSITNIKNAFISFIYPSFKSIFAPICIINFIFLLINLKKKNNLTSILLLTGLITSIKSIGGISFEIYGTYFFPLLFIGLITSLYKEEKKIRNIYLCIICLVLTSLYFTFSINERNNLASIRTNKGTINIPRIFYNSTNEILNYLKNKNNKKILILPEGAFINYLTNTQTDNYLYYLIPPNNNIFKKEFIENRIKSDDIDYIITTNIQYPWFNEKSFITGWGKEYIEIIKKEYTQETIIGENLKFYIYKRDIIN